MKLSSLTTSILLTATSALVSAAPGLEDQTAKFGALTLAGSGGYTVTDTSGEPLTSVIDKGTGTAKGYELSDGVVTPASDGSLATEDGSYIDIVSDQLSARITLSVEKDTYSALDTSEVNTAYRSISKYGGDTIRLREGVHRSSGRGGLFFSKKNPSKTVTFSSYDRSKTILSGSTWVERSSNLIIDGFTFESGGGDLLLLYGNTHDIVVQNNEVRSTNPIDPFGDYSKKGPAYAHGIRQAVGKKANISYLSNHIHNVSIGINAREPAGSLRIEGNRIENVYNDGIKVTPGAEYTSIKDNYIAGLIGSGSNKGNPHPDFIQFIGGGTTDWENIEIERNILVALYPEAGAQGIFLKNTSRKCAFRAAIRGNLILQRGKDVGIVVSPATGCEITNNTVVNNGKFINPHGPMILLNAIADADPTLIKNNVYPRIHVSQSDGALPVIQRGNHELPENSEKGYAALFAGPDFVVNTRQEALSKFAMLKNGPLDAEDGGEPGEGNAGAVGSGYVSWPDESPGRGGSIHSPDSDELGTP